MEKAETGSGNGPRQVRNPGGVRQNELGSEATATLTGKAGQRIRSCCDAGSL